MSENRKVVFEIDASAQPSIDVIAKYKKEITELQEANKSLKKEVKEHGDETGELTREMVKNESKIRANKKEMRDSQKIVDSSIQQSKNQKGSINELGAELASLKAQYRGLSEEERENEEVGGALLSEIQEKDEAYKDLQTSIGTTQVNVGDYTKAIEKAIPGVGGLTGKLGALTGGLASATAGKKGAAGAARLLGLALKAIPILAIVGAISSLIAYFRRTERGADQLRKITAMLSAVFDTLMDVVIKVGEALFNAVKAPDQAWKDFQQTVADTVQFFEDSIGKVMVGQIMILGGHFAKFFAHVNLGWQELKGLVSDNTEAIEEARERIVFAEKVITNYQEVRKEGLDAIADAYTNIRDRVRDGVQAIRDNVREAGRLADQRARLDRIERQYLVENERLRTQAANARAESERLKLSNAEASIEQLERALELDLEVIENEKELARIRLENHRDQMALSEDTKQDREELASLEAAYESQIRALAEAERRSAREVNSARREAFRQQQERRAVELETEKLVSDGIIKEQQRIIDNEDATIRERLMAMEKVAQLRAEMRERETELEIQEIRNRMELGLVEEEQAQLQLQLIEQRSKQEQLEIQREYNYMADALRQEQIESAKAQAEEEKRIARERAAAEIAARQEVVNAAMQAGQDMLSTAANMAAEGTAQQKLFAVADAIMNTYVAVTRAMRSLPPPASYAAAATTLAQGMSAVRRIKQTEPGGSIGGSSFGGSNVRPTGQATIQQAGQSQQIVQTIQQMPRPVVTVEDINAGLNRETTRVEGAKA